MTELKVDNMLYIKTKIGLSKIEGIGLFANESIKKGTFVWKYDDKFDIKFDKNSFDEIKSKHAKEQILKYAYLNKNTFEYVLCGDDARFFNHSDNPNVIGLDYEGESEGINIAIRDIDIGEELTVDYRQYDADFDKKVNPEK